MVRGFPNGPGDRDSIPGRDIPKTQKMVLYAALFSTQHYKERIKDEKRAIQEVAPSPTPLCSSYWKQSFRIAFDYGHQLYESNHSPSSFG